MGFLASHYFSEKHQVTFNDVQVTIRGSYALNKSSFILCPMVGCNTMPSELYIVARYSVYVNEEYENLSPILEEDVFLPVEVVPENVYSTIYESIKSKILEASPEAVFTDN